MLKERLRESGRSLRKRANEGDREGRLGGLRMLKLVVIDHGGSCVFVSELFNSLVWVWEGRHLDSCWIGGLLGKR